MPEPLSQDEIVAETVVHLPELQGLTISGTPITKGGSDRNYYRLVAGGPHPLTYVLMHYTEVRPDNLCFAAATELLSAHGIDVPKIFAHDPVRMLMWLEDLGDTDLWSFRDFPWESPRPLYESVLHQMSRIHRIAEAELPADVLSGLQPGFDAALYGWEQRYFFDQFAARFSRAREARGTAWEDDPELMELRSRLASQPRFLVHRDFQSHNVLVHHGRTCLIDYQGLRPGRPEYDLASLLYDPYVPLTKAERLHLVEFYLALHPGLDHAASFHQNLVDCAYQRLMQALGAYGYLGAACGKRDFLGHIPQAVATLRDLVYEHGGPAILDAVLARDAIELS